MVDESMELIGGPIEGIDRDKPSNELWPSGDSGPVPRGVDSPVCVCMRVCVCVCVCVFVCVICCGI